MNDENEKEGERETKRKEIITFIIIMTRGGEPQPRRMRACKGAGGGGPLRVSFHLTHSFLQFIGDKVL